MEKFRPKKNLAIKRDGKDSGRTKWKAKFLEYL